MSVELSIVIPVYKGEESLEELHSRIIVVLEKTTQSFEIILVDDCSPDQSFIKMKELRQKDPRVKIIGLMRNFGQHNAIMCGLNHAQGNLIITMDDDLQNPPEEIPKLIHKIKQGYDAVIGMPMIKRHFFLRNLGSYLIGKSFEQLFHKPTHIRMSSFRILRKSLVDAVIRVKTPHPMIDALILSNTTNIANVVVEHDIRKHGTSNYSLFRSTQLALDLLVNYSTIPLHIISINGFVFSVVGLLFGIYVVIGRITGIIGIVGWASTVALLSFFSGMILMSFGVVGEYLIRIIHEVSHFRQYVIKESSYNQVECMNRIDL